MQSPTRLLLIGALLAPLMTTPAHSQGFLSRLGEIGRGLTEAGSDLSGYTRATELRTGIPRSFQGAGERGFRDGVWSANAFHTMRQAHLLEGWLDRDPQTRRSHFWNRPEWEPGDPPLPAESWARHKPDWVTWPELRRHLGVTPEGTHDHAALSTQLQAIRDDLARVHYQRPPTIPDLMAGNIQSANRLRRENPSPDRKQLWEAGNQTFFENLQHLHATQGETPWRLQSPGPADLQRRFAAPVEVEAQPAVRGGPGILGFGGPAGGEDGLVGSDSF